jgi:hypothetical protein
MAGCLSILAGAVIGLILGAFGCAAGMTLAGGGNSHNDLFTGVGGTLLGALAGAVAWPLLWKRILALQAERRIARANHEPPRFPVGFVLSLLGAAVLLFSSGTLLYYSSAIAELPPEMGGPRSAIPGEMRARAALIAGVVAGAAALFLFVKTLRDTRGGRTE